MAALDADEAMSDKANELAAWALKEADDYMDHSARAKNLRSIAGELTRLAEVERLLQRFVERCHPVRLRALGDGTIESVAPHYDDLIAEAAALGAKDKGER
jgi:hypothetical protein